MTFTPPTTPEAWEQARKDGLQTVFNWGNTPWPWFDGEKFYSLESYKPYSEAKPIDFAKARSEVELAHQHGVRVIGVMMPMWEYKVLDDHRDWQLLQSPTANPVDPFSGQVPPLGCYMSPFGDFYIRKNMELIKAIGWDGQNIDGFHTYILCYCPFCRNAYKDATGGEVPLKTDANDPNYRRFVTWRLREWGKFVKKWQVTIKQEHPDFAFTPWSTGPGRWWHWAALPDAQGSELGNLMTDAPVVELFWDYPPNQANNLLPSFTTRFYRGFCQERPVWMAPYYRSQGQQNAVTPLVESEFRFLTVITNGGVPPVAGFHMDHDTTESHFYQILKAREPWLKDATSTKWAAILVSEKSYLFYGIPGSRAEYGGVFIGSGIDTKDVSASIPSERRFPAHLESAVGMFRACMEAHLPFDLISDLDIEQGTRLDRYKVLILPDAACLSENALARIRSFVDAGGGLVATQASSLYDENGGQRGNFGLADLFSANFKALKDHTGRWPNHANTADVMLMDHEVTKHPTIQGNFGKYKDSVNYIGWTVETEASSGSTVVAQYYPYENWQPKPDNKHPFLILSEARKGRVAYFAAAIDQAYFLSPYQFERPLMINAIRWAAGNNLPPVEVDAPMCVQSAFYEQDNGKRTVVHLLNEINTTGGRAWPESDPSMREEIVPIADITVRFRNPAITKATLQPEGIDLALTKVDNGFEVKVPQLRMHSMVIAE